MALRDLDEGEKQILKSLGTPGALARAREAAARNGADAQRQTREGQSPVSIRSPGTPLSQHTRSPSSALENAKIPDAWMAPAPSSSGSRLYEKPWKAGSAASKENKKRKGDVRFADSSGKGKTWVLDRSEVDSDNDADASSTRIVGSTHSQQHRQQKQQQPGSSSPASPNDIPWTEGSASAYAKRTPSPRSLPLPPQHHHFCERHWIAVAKQKHVTTLTLRHRKLFAVV